MNNEPVSYEELIRKKRCIEMTKYYYLTQDDLNTIYDFLSNNRNGEVIGGKGIISFVINKKTQSVLPAKQQSLLIDGVILTNSKFSVIRHYDSSSGYSSSSSGGGSSNNNNNNNNNNNR